MSKTWEIAWRSEGCAVDPWQALQPAPCVNSGFSEKKRYSFQKPFPECRFFVDDEPLRDHAEEPLCWIWEPGFFAGEVTAELIRNDGSSAGLFLLDVAPDSNKLGREVFAQMVADLWEEDPALVSGVEPATSPSSESGVVAAPWAAFARLRRYGPEVLRALDSIRSRPRRTLRVCRDSAPAHQARRVDRRTATAVLRSSAVALFTDGADGRTRFNQNSRLDVPQTEETMDSAANRTLLSLVQKLLRRTRTLSEQLQRTVERAPVSETRTALAARWPRRRQFLEDLATQLTAALRRPPFTEAHRVEITAAGLTAIAADPTYSRAWSVGWRALRQGIEANAMTERLWMSPSWELYERWCFVRLGQLLAARMPAWRWSRGKDRWAGSCGGWRAELLLQPTFGANRSGAGRMWSVSGERVPDFVLKIEGPIGLRFAVLDAKYSASRSSVLKAMESAHIYQDSLRMGSLRPEVSLLLIPSPGGAEWLEDPEFQAEHRVGAHAFIPGREAALPKMIADLMANWGSDKRRE